MRSLRHDMRSLRHGTRSLRHGTRSLRHGTRCLRHGTRCLRQGERGAGTVLLLAVVLVGLLVAAGLATVASAHAARGRAQAAADLAALAGATALGRHPADEACRLAGEAARRNGAELRSCHDEPVRVLVVEVAASGAGMVAVASARAGPRGSQ
jgi:secretion/DNA translocation related TadE-like protein